MDNLKELVLLPTMESSGMKLKFHQECKEKMTVSCSVTQNACAFQSCKKKVKNLPNTTGHCKMYRNFLRNWGTSCCRKFDLPVIYTLSSLCVRSWYSSQIHNMKKLRMREFGSLQVKNYGHCGHTNCHGMYCWGSFCLSVISGYQQIFLFLHSTMQYGTSKTRHTEYRTWTSYSM